MPSTHIFDQALLAQALNASRCGIVIADAQQPDTPIVFANESFTEITGYTSQEILGKNCRFLQKSTAEIPENEPELQKLRRAIKSGTSTTVELRNFRKDGTPFWNELTLSPIRDAIGKLTHFIGVQSDITRRKEAELELARARQGLTKRVGFRTAELREQGERLYNEILEHRKTGRALQVAEKKFRGIFENAVEGIYQSTPEGKYIAVNPALARLYGYDSATQLMEQVNDITTDIYVDPSVREQFKAAIAREGAVRNLEYQVRSRDGSLIWICEHARVVRDAKGAILYYEGTIQDITARKAAETEAAKLEARLRQTQKLEAVGTLASGIAHDFNNVLASIIGYTQLIELDTPSSSPTYHHLNRVMSACERGRDLIRQILSFSRNSAPERKHIRLGSIVREALKLLRATVPSTIEFQSNIITDEDWTFADAIQIHQILMNLAANACHAMREKGGLLQVTLDLDSSLDSKFLRLKVSDTGHGIPPEIVGRIFEPFFTTKPVGEGTGLGLSVVHGIVRDHGGSISVESQPGHGTTFTVLLPKSNQAPKTAPSEIPQIRRGNGQRILIVDDEEAIVSMLEVMLRRLNYNPVATTRSREAMTLIKTDPVGFDLILTDQTMPELTGLDLAFAASTLQNPPPLIICSGYPQNIPPDKAKQSHITAIIQKPIKLAELSQVLAEALAPLPK